MMRAIFAMAGGFSLINGRLEQALVGSEKGIEWETVNVLDAVLNERPGLRMLATISALWEFGSVILKNRIPPRDVVVRLPVFQRALHAKMRSVAAGCGFTFQTQSLFDASCEGVPHFLYTDHTFLANRRYSPPRPTWPASAGWRAMEGGLYRSARVCFTSSRFAADSICEDYGVAADRVEVVGSGCNVDLPSEAPVRAGRGGRILFVGVEWERKGGPVLMDALREVRQIHPHVSLDVVGCNPQLGEPWVRVHGRVHSEQVAGFFREADVFCLPSLAEPSASVLVEAAGFGLPVVATRVGGSPERVMDGRTGLLVGAGDVRALAGAIGRLVGDPTTAAVMGTAGRELVLREFTWTATARRIMDRIGKELA